MSFVQLRPYINRAATSCCWEKLATASPYMYCTYCTVQSDKLHILGITVHSSPHQASSPNSHVHTASHRPLSSVIPWHGQGILSVILCFHHNKVFNSPWSYAGVLHRGVASTEVARRPSISQTFPRDDPIPEPRLCRQGQYFSPNRD